MNIQEIRISDISPDPDQPRKTFDAETLERLTQSIIDNGIEQPIIVRKNGTGYIIIDGERRWRASNKAGIKIIPSIVSGGENTRRKQLRTNCLKDGLSDDELDNAVYELYEDMLSSTLPHPSRVNKDVNPYAEMIAKEIGKSRQSVSISIERVEFKKENTKEVDEIKQKAKSIQKGTGFNYLNATIAQTSPLNKIENVEVRKEAIRMIMDEKTKPKNKREWSQESVNQAVKEKVQLVKKLGNDATPNDVKEIFRTGFSKKLLPDIIEIYDKSVNEIIQAIASFRTKKFLDHAEHLDFSELIQTVETFLNQLKKSSRG